MAKLTDKFFNRVIEGDLKLEAGDASGVAPAVNPLVSQAIQADKDILSQIEYEYEEDVQRMTLTFPEGVLPIGFTESEGETYLFDYKNYRLHVVDSSDFYEIDDIFLENGKLVVMVYMGEITIEELLYIARSGLSMSYYPDFNAIFNPITSAGTKLYLHTLTPQLGYEELENIIVVSLRTTKYTQKSQIISDFEDGKVLYMFNKKAKTTIFEYNGDLYAFTGSSIASVGCHVSDDTVTAL